MTREVARQLGYDVCPFEGSWGEAAPEQPVWQLRDVAWPAHVAAAAGRRFPTEAAALAEVEHRVAYQLGVSVEDLRVHLALVLTPKEVS